MVGPGCELTIAAPRFAGALLCVVGVIWLGQGLGVIGGSFMSGQPVWAAVGAVCLVAGVVLLAWGSALRRKRSDPDE